jgi:hypothetical protein
VLFIESYPQLIPLSLNLVSQDTLPLHLLDGLSTLLHSLFSSTTNYSKARTLLLKQKDFILNLSGAICRLLSLLPHPSSSSSSSGSPLSSSLENSFQSLSEIFKDFIFSEDGKKSIFTSTQTAPSIVVAVFGSILERYYEEKTVKQKSSKSSKLLSDLAERSIEILLGCSQLEDLRPTFLNPLDKIKNLDPKIQETSEESLTNTNTTIQVILKLSLLEEWIQSNGLAILMNLTIQDDQSIRQILLDNQALEVCLQLIKQHTNTTSNEESSSRLRAIGLLSRLGTLTEAQVKLKQPDCYVPLITLFIANTQQLLQTSLPSNFTILRDESHQLIRLFAAITSPPEACLSEAYRLGYLDMLLAYLPMPKMELHEITPQSVILTPNETSLWNRNNSLLVGNIARCLIPWADHSVYSQAIFSSSSSSSPSSSPNGNNYGLEKLVCMMATCSDIRVRKNIAIVLAKGCRVAEVKKRVEHYRGLQMIVELQHQLV